MHLAGELFMRESGAQMVHVPFNNPGNANTNLISGELQLMFQLVTGVATQVKAGRVRALGVMSAQRSPALPDVPTMVELGQPKLMSSTWFALLAPKGTAAPVLERMNAVANEVLSDPAVKKAPRRHGRQHPRRYAEAAGRSPGRRNREVGSAGARREDPGAVKARS